MAHYALGMGSDVLVCRKSTPRLSPTRHQAEAVLQANNAGTPATVGSELRQDRDPDQDEARDKHGLCNNEDNSSTAYVENTPKRCFHAYRRNCNK
jgi:hypothetical protein